MRTHFSNDTWIESIKNDDIIMTANQLNYFMWETSTDTISQVGMPTDEDVQEWKHALWGRSDFTWKECRDLIKSCNDYVGNK